MDTANSAAASDKMDLSGRKHTVFWKSRPTCRATPPILGNRL